MSIHQGPGHSPPHGWHTGREDVVSQLGTRAGIRARTTRSRPALVPQRAQEISARHCHGSRDGCKVHGNRSKPDRRSTAAGRLTAQSGRRPCRRSSGRWTASSWRLPPPAGERARAATATGSSQPNPAAGAGGRGGEWGGGEGSRGEGRAGKGGSKGVRKGEAGRKRQRKGTSGVEDSRCCVPPHPAPPAPSVSLHRPPSRTSMPFLARANTI